MEDVQKAFDAIADRYDSQRRYIIPEFDAFYASAVWAAEWEGAAPRILDIGAGTGLLGALLLDRYPMGTLTLVDISAPMLDVARRRFQGQGNVRCIVRDYRSDLPEGSYDIIVSALSIHHLERNEKRLLYGRIFAALDPGGVFVNAEQVEGETPWQQAHNVRYWNEFVLSGPLSQEEVIAMCERRERLDRMEKLPVQIQWLRDSGFGDVDVVYKNRSFAVFMGRKT
jgi:tRNA (cmo5U34)-methyltransferase